MMQLRPDVRGFNYHVKTGYNQAGKDIGTPLYYSFGTDKNPKRCLGNHAMPHLKGLASPVRLK